MTENPPRFEDILGQFHKRVYNLAYRLVGDREEAADITQETFVRAYKAYSGFRGSLDNVYPWLCKILVNGCKNRFRDLNRKNRFEALSLDAPVDGCDSDLCFEIADVSTDPAGVAEKHELFAKLNKAIQELPAEFRLVVVLRDMNGLSYKEIADVTGLSMETVKARLFRGRAALRQRLRPYIEE